MKPWIRYMLAPTLTLTCASHALFASDCKTVFAPLDPNIKPFQLRNGDAVSILHPEVIPFQEDLPKGVKTQNFQFHLGNALQRLPAADAVAISLGRGAEGQLNFDEALTNRHQLYGNSFAKTAADGQKVEFTPAVSSVPMAMNVQAFNSLVLSTAPIMNALRTILQNFYGWGATAQTIAHIKQYLPGLSEQEVLQVLAIMEQSAYFEPFFRRPEMATYPFLPIARFDSVISDPDQPHPEFFEFNAGTPSGLSNLKQLLGEMRNIGDPAFSALEPFLVADDSFGKLRRSIFSAAALWTGTQDGIVVTIGPGPKNGAHPDIVNIALFSGMPYVDMQDLYIDPAGYVRLNTAHGKHPRVIGIYNRREESYLVQSSNLGIPLRNPYFEQINATLSHKQNLRLEPFVGYKVFFDNTNEPERVEVDANGYPVLQDLVDGLGVAPNNAQVRTGSLAEAIVLRRIYVSNLGGRVVDDKHLFELLAKGLKPLFPLLAKPPPTLSIDEKRSLAAGENLNDFVIKETNKSGGDGVYIMALLPDAKREEVRRLVLRNPENFVVQRFTNLVTTVVASKAAGQIAHFQPRVVDWGLFVYQDAAGNVASDPMSILPRVADMNGLSTNTSRGAGYGIAAVVDDVAQASTGYDLRQPANPYLTASQMTNLLSLIEQLNQIQPVRDAEDFPIDPLTLKESVRLAMPVLGRTFFPIMHLCENANKNPPIDFVKNMLTWKGLLAGNSPNHPVVNTVAQRFLRERLK